MSLPPDFLDDLRTRTGLAALIGRRVKLTRAGREWKGCCPFHNEKTPSFYVNEDKGFYHCFGCGAHGDAIGFAMADGGLSFIEAVKSLAAEAGLAVPEPRAADPAEQKRAGLHAILGAAADWFQTQLASARGADARAYLARRGVSAAIAQQFGIGFAPDQRGALSAALRSGFADLEDVQLQEAGLTGQSDAGETYDRFRSRLMFPIHDRRGRTVGFGGRALGPVEPKYLNSAEGPAFAKGRLLYNFHRAAPAARKTGRLLLVEGYMDVVGLAGVGITEAVAPLGTALTEDQLALAWTLVDEPILAFDGDGAGQRAGLRAAIRALPQLRPGKSLRFLALPPGQDPDDLARSGGAAAIEALIASARPLDRFLFDTEGDAAAADTPERRAALRKRLMAHADQISDPDLRRDYQRTFAQRFDALLRPIRQGPGRPMVPRGSQTGKGRHDQCQPPAPLRAETRAAAAGAAGGIIAMLLKSLALRPHLVANHAEMLADLPIPDHALGLVRDALLGGASLDGGSEAGLSHRVHSLLDAELADEEFDRRIGRTLASLIELHHIDQEMQAPRDLSDMARAAEQVGRLRMARADALQRLAAFATDTNSA